MELGFVYASPLCQYQKFFIEILHGGRGKAATKFTIYLLHSYEKRKLPFKDGNHCVCSALKTEPNPFRFYTACGKIFQLSRVQEEVKQLDSGIAIGAERLQRKV